MHAIDPFIVVAVLIGFATVAGWLGGQIGLGKRVKDLTYQNEDNKDLVAKLWEDLTAMTITKNNLLINVDVLKKDLKAMTADRDEWQGRHKVCISIRDQYYVDWQGVKAERDAARRECLNVASLMKKIGELNAECDDERKKRERAQEALKELEAKYVEMQTSRNEWWLKHVDLTKEVENKNIKLPGIERMEYKAKIASLEKSLEISKKDLSNRDAIIKNLTTPHAVDAFTKLLLESDNPDVQSMLARLRGALVLGQQLSSAERSEYKSKLAAATTSLEQANRNVAHWREMHHELTTANNNTIDDFLRLKAERARLADKVVRFEKELAEWPKVMRSLFAHLVKTTSAAPAPGLVYETIKYTGFANSMSLVWRIFQEAGIDGKYVNMVWPSTFSSEEA